jgi:hypothetical protein
MDLMVNSPMKSGLSEWHSDVLVRTVVGVVTLNFSTVVGETSDVLNSDAIHFRLSSELIIFVAPYMSRPSVRPGR